MRDVNTKYTKFYYKLLSKMLKSKETYEKCLI